MSSKGRNFNYTFHHETVTKYVASCYICCIGSFKRFIDFRGREKGGEGEKHLFVVLLIDAFRG